MAYIGDLKLICMDSGGLAQPDSGYHLIAVDLNKNAGGKYIYLTYKKTDNIDEAITSISVIAGLTSNYPIQRGHTKMTQDICEGAGPKYNLYYVYQGGTTWLASLRWIGCNFRGYQSHLSSRALGS